MAAARAAADPRDRVVMELLARTGMRAGELADLEADAVVRIGAGHWLRIPLGKLRNDRYVPLHPQLVELLATWTAANLDHIRRHKRLAADHRGPLSRYQIGRVAARIGRNCGLHVHPTNSATPSPPRPTAAACGWRPSPPCPGIAPWK
jgi:integrase/recombinase XerD